MDFTVPIASKKRLDELLEYLAQPCSSYCGNRADDFKSFVDVDSEWAWMYADLVLRGIEHRELPYVERHHVVPFSCYRLSGFKGRRQDPYVCENNMTSLTYMEHIFAHYILVKCSKGVMISKNAYAFIQMWRTKNKCSKKTLPQVDEVLAFISEHDVEKIKQDLPHIRRVSLEGRTHYSEDPKKARYEYGVRYRTEHAEEIRANKKKYSSENADKIRKRKELTKEHDREVARIWKANHPDYSKQSYYRNHANRLEQAKKYREEHPDKVKALWYTYYASHKEELKSKARIQGHERYWANKDICDARNRKAYHEKVEQGFRRRRNPSTGKTEWVFVGKPTNVFFASYNPNYVELDGSPFYTEEDFMQATGT